MEKGTGDRVDEIRMYGGSSKNRVWNQIFADVIGVKVVTTDTAETTALGAAICAAKGVGLYKSFEEAVSNMVRVMDKYMPDQEHHKLYSKLYSEVYVKFYDRVKDLIKNTGAIITHHKKN